MKVVAGILILLLLILTVGGCVAHSEAKGFLDSKADIPNGEVVVEIPKGATHKTVADLLARQGVVRNGKFFYYYLRYLVRFEGMRDIKAGEYLFKSGTTPREVAAKLFKGEIHTYKVTIPEGLRYDEIAEIFAARKLADRERFIELCTDRVLIKSLGLEADSLEGYLAPETYTLAKGLPTEQVVRMLHKRFRDVFDRHGLALSGKGLSMHQAVTLASIVEKETGAPEERPLIAAVFSNRLKKKMRLQTDPTVIYGILRTKGAFDGNLTRKDLETPTPYNTYTIPGLPPGPISNPGAAAIEAVAHPAESDAVFFVSKNNGTHVFCPDYACHLKAVQKWQVEYFNRKK
ncbi:MAG: endolytic transglycosylase MltG [Deltaproteobacteria bacterium]|nr:endolytic transglycosylase MltG [Deltaproteobacteria bacterium]